MDGSLMLNSECGTSSETISNCLVPNWWLAAAASDSTLADEIGYPQVGLDGHELHLPQFKRHIGTVPMPTTIFRFRLFPSLRQRQHKSLAPATDVVADVDDDLVALGIWLSCIAGDVLNAAHQHIVLQTSQAFSADWFP